MTEEATSVFDNGAAHRFEITIDGHLAELTYRRTGDRLVLSHTGVPHELEGRGVGGTLVRAALETAQRQGLTLVPRCQFAAGWLERHPEDVRGVTIEPAG